MPTPILKIPVDSSAFDRYMQAFKRYQDSLEAQPEMWKGVNKEMATAAIAGAALAESIEEQTEAARKLEIEETKREQARKKIEEDKRREAREVEKREESAAKRRRDAIRDVREYARTVTSFALNAAKWTVGGGLMGSALGMFGLTSLAGWAGDERRLAGGLGVSMSQRQGLGVQMQRYFDVNSTLQRMGEMQVNPADWGVFAMMGINPRGKTPAELALESANAVRREYRASGGDLTRMAAKGYTRAYGLEDIRRIGTEDEATWQKSVESAKRFQGLQDAVARKWQDFTAKVDEAGLTIKNRLTDKLLELNSRGQLDKIINSFTDLAVSGIDAFGKFLSSPEVQESLESFTKFLGTEEFRTDMETIASGFKKIGDGVLWLLSKFPSEANMGNAANGAITGAVAGGLRAGIPGAVVGGTGGFFLGGSDWFNNSLDYLRKTPSDKAAKDAVNAVGRWFGTTFGGQSNGTLADRNNNPGNLIDPKTGRFRQFNTLDEGASAMARQLIRNYDRGQNTVRSLINDPKWGWSNQWSPGNSAASTNAYISRVSQELGVSPDTPINLRDDTTLKKLMVAMNGVERGGKRKANAPTYRGYGRQVEVKIKNQTGASVATNVNSAVQG